MKNKKRKIGTLQESSLHNQLKHELASSKKDHEQQIDGFVIDFVEDNELVEIQTTSFYAIKEKLFQLIEDHKIRLVYPIAEKTWLIKLTSSNEKIERRKSPKKGRYVDVFYELVRIPKLLNNENFTLQLVLIHKEEVRRDDGKGSWRRGGWSILDHKLLEIVDTKLIQSGEDLIALYPKPFPKEFTNKDLYEMFEFRKTIIQKTTYVLRKLGTIKLIGKQGRYNLYNYKNGLE